MAKHTFTILALIAAFAFAPAAQQTASARIELSEIESQTIKIEQQGNTIVVSGAAGKTVCVYNLIGSVVTTIRIESNEKRIDLSQLPKGIYPVKVGNISKKIHISGR